MTMCYAASRICCGSVLSCVDLTRRLPFSHAHALACLGLRSPAGLLLHGPPSVGKALAVATAARHAGAMLLTVCTRSLA